MAASKMKVNRSSRCVLLIQFCVKGKFKAPSYSVFFKPYYVDSYTDPEFLYYYNLKLKKSMLLIQKSSGSVFSSHYHYSMIQTTF